MNSNRYTNFGEYPIFGVLAVVLPDIAVDFRGDLLSLTVLDVFASRYSVPVSLSAVWEKLMNAREIAHFTIACGKGYGINSTESSLSELEAKAQASLGRQRDTRARSSLLAVLENMLALFNAEENEASPRVYCPDCEVEGYCDRLERGIRFREQCICCIPLALQMALMTAENGPAANFDINLCREGMTHLHTGDLQTNGPESGPGDEGESQLAADSQGILSISRALVDVRLGASDGCERSGSCDYEREAFDEDSDDYDLFHPTPIRFD